MPRSPMNFGAHSAAWFISYGRIFGCLEGVPNRLRAAREFYLRLVFHFCLAARCFLDVAPEPAMQTFPVEPARIPYY